MRALSHRQLVDAGMAFTLLCLILHFVLSPGRTMAILATVTLVVTMTVPRWLRPLAFLWFRFSELLGGVMSRVILACVWAGVVVPVGAVVSWFRGDVLGLKAFRRKPGSLFVDRRHTYSAKDLSNPY